MGLTQVNNSYYLDQSYHMGRNNFTKFKYFAKQIMFSESPDHVL